MREREKSPVFSLRSPEHYGVPREDDATPSNDPILEDYSEADALYDLNHKMLQVEKVLETCRESGVKISGFTANSVERAIQGARDIRKDLTFIGNTELDEACAGLAEHWMHKLRAGKELYLMVDTCESSIFICNKVLDVVQGLDAESEYEDKINVVHSDNVYDVDRKRIKENGLIIVDDWLISGDQMIDMANWLTKYCFLKLSRSDLEYNLVCAPGTALDQGLKGVPVKAYFRREVPPDYAANSESTVSVTGSHCNTDYGFGCFVDNAFNALRSVDGYENYPFPILYQMARPYRIHDTVNALRLERKSFSPLNDSAARLGKNIKQRRWWPRRQQEDSGS